MMRKVLLNMALLLTISSLGYSQGDNNSYGIWNLNSVNGEVLLKSFYLNKYDELRGFSDRQQGTYFQGGIKIHTKSIIWHPNFIQLDVGGEYSPELNQDKYLVAPDKSEVRTLKELNLRMAIFSSLPISLNSFFTINENYRNRENLTNIKSNTRTWGTNLALRNKFLPVYFSYDNHHNTINEIQTGRNYLLEQKGFYANTNKSFGQTDRHQLRFSYNSYFRNEADIAQIENTTRRINLDNNIYFDSEKKYSYRSLIYYYNRSGDQAFNIANITESIRFALPENLTLDARYNYYSIDQVSQKSVTNKISSSLSHRLFKSLISRVGYEYSNIKNTFYNETRNRAGISLNYVKKVPSGRLSLNYSYSLLDNKMDSDPLVLPVINEEYILDDTRIILLNQPNIDINSIIVRDVTGTIIYQQVLDYLLIESGNYIEIRRVPGGQISDLSAVYLDYTAFQTGSYSYNENMNNLNVNLNILNNILELYYNGRSLNYSNVVKSDLLVLNYLYQNTIGSRINIAFTQFGVEYENHNSTITPYKMVHAFGNIQKDLRYIILTFNANYRNFNMVDEGINREYSDLTGKAVYRINNKMDVNLSLTQRKQIGPGIDLDLFIARTEYNAVFRKVYLKAGIDLYLRNYLGFDSNYLNSYIQVSRKF